MSARKPIDAPKKSMTEKILLVEDDPMIGEAVVNALADAGKAADWARSGWEATGFLSENKYDALLLDLGLPGKDGMSVLRELRGQGCAPSNGDARVRRPQARCSPTAR